ncbi:MAG: hypothetical protein Q8P79_00685 [Nanoarchaeota archaeon]|nr:hypothetical protein [Nanoarchaeota archaeon]
MFILLAILAVFSLSSVYAASSYSRNVPAYTFGQQTAPFTGGQPFFPFDRSMCQAGQDFILQVDPLGCTPSVIRSDLLEEQEVVVFCPIIATQLNPLIEIKDIDHLVITSRDLPREVLTVGYHPARAALGRMDPQIENQFFENIGYATIVLKRQPNESAMPDFVQGNLTARMVYDIDNAFGTGRALYYLSQLSDVEWDRDYVAYSFWDGRGYLRLESSDNEGATIGVYSDRDITGTGRLGEKTKVATLNLEKGKSGEVFLPGFNYCRGGLEIKLNDLTNPDTRARLRIDSDVQEWTMGEKFLENKCEIRSMTKHGINQKVEISCREDQRRNTFSLSINPKVSLSIDGTTKEYGAGDRLYQKSDDLDKSIYLVYVGTKDGSLNENSLFAVTAAVPGNKAQLTAEELNSIAGFVNRKSYSEVTNLASLVANIAKFSVSTAERALRAVVDGQGFRNVNIGETKEIFGGNVNLIGFSGPHDLDISSFPSNVKDNYENAIEDYESIKESFASETYPPSNIVTLGEQALTEAIRLANELGQRKTASDLCKDFTDTYNSPVPQACNQYSLSNTQISGQGVVINGRTHVISFEGTREPRFEEFGAKILVQDANGNVVGDGPFNLAKNQIITLNDTTGETIELLDLDEDSARLRINLGASAIEKARQFVRDARTIEIGTPNDFGSQYLFTLQEVNLQKVAKVSINPQIDYARANATFSFKIGIEKRGIQLSPEKTKEKINELNETIEKWTKISDGLGKVVETGKAACLATGAALTIKNFFSNLGGKGIARQQVMRADDVGWYDKCQEEVRNLAYDDVEACLLANNDAIESSVNAYDSAIARQNQEIQNLEEGISDTRFLGEKVVNTDALAERLIDPDLRTEISSNTNGVFAGNQITVGNQNIPVSTIIGNITTDTTTISQARNLQLNSRLLDSSDETVRAIAKSNVEKILGEIYSNSRAETTRQTYISNYGIPAIIGATTPLKEYPLSQVNTFADLKGQFTGASIPDDSFVTVFVDQSTGKEYLLVLNNDFVITQTYSITNNVLSVASPDNVNPLGVSLKRYDTTSYNNKYIDPLVRYYETDPYKGLPSVVPFDVENGWYAAVKSNLPLLGGIRAYDDSGRVSSFYVCNVGLNGREENIGGDDICRGFVPGAGQSPDFPGLDPRESARKMDQAVNAIRAATDAYRSGVSQVTVNNQRVKVGEPAANIPDIQCQDFMSPSDCNLMFNVCDPVICPSSRCDLGGTYPVKDVIQSGIVGSLALCLPNWPEIKVPICVSGVHAGLEGYLSVLNSYEQCLQTSLDTGATVGICDELNSVYMCEFFWRQGLPLAKYALPKVIGNVLGGTSRGGGEYLGVADAWSNAEKSVGFFSQYYAANSFQAFKARSAEAAGGEICRNWVSISGPEGNLFDALTAPDSPVQFYGRFEEIPYTTATNPPASQYKVFYHIFAGKDLPAYFQVYLRGTGSSFFQDTNLRRPVRSGFIPAGDFKTETIDFTAPSGYKELCIVVNGQEVCGFKQVTTEFGINYLSEQYVAQQASQTDIKSEAECVSGTPSAFSFLNPNVQAGAEEALNPAIYNRGIIRICATDNPGTNTNPSRWNEVGTCGSQNLKCWLDRDSVKDVVRNAYTEEQILGEVEDQYMSALQAEGLYMDDDAFSSFRKEIDELEGQDTELITKIDQNIARILLNNQKAYLHLRRGNSYGNLARIAYDRAISAQKSPTGTEETPSQETGEVIKCEDCGSGLFNVCDEVECTELSRQSGKACSFEDKVVNTCTEDTQTTQTTSLTCSNSQSCQITLGQRVMELAQQKKQTRNIADSGIKSDTGAESFECLALQVAWVESRIRHCKANSTVIVQSYNGNPLYCDGNLNEVISGDEFTSIGIMQINTAVHTNVDVSDFEDNVNYGLDLLINADKTAKTYRCYMPGGYRATVPVASASSFFNLVSYSGWKAALRNYNGWNTACYNSTGFVIGNPNYVEDVIAAKANVANLFSECA